LNSKLHAVCDGLGRPVAMFLSKGQMSDYKGARHLLDAVPKANVLLADRGYDADWFRDALRGKGIEPCMPPKKTAKSKSNMMKRFISSVIKSKTCSQNLKTGGALQPDMTDALTHSRPQSPLLLSSYGGFNES
jgi:putative transposase